MSESSKVAKMFHDTTRQELLTSRICPDEGGGSYAVAQDYHVKPDRSKTESCYSWADSDTLAVDLSSVSDSSETVDLASCDNNQALRNLQHPSRVQMSVVVPEGKTHDMVKILKPLFSNVKGLDRVVDIVEKQRAFPFVSEGFSQTVPHYTVSGDEMSAPALTLMLFAPEHGPGSMDQLKAKFGRFPWRHHHTIQLQNSKSSNIVVGSQEFYFLSRQLPLWSVCSSPTTVRRVRFNLFVRRFHAMVEFYRLITGTEMESSKQGFCLFPLSPAASTNEAKSCHHHSHPMTTTVTQCELSLKHCPHVNPYPLNHSYLVFPVHNLTSLREVLKAELKPLRNQHYLIHDPDGNPLVLHDVTFAHNQPSPAAVSSNYQSNCKNRISVTDKASVHSDSIDSGRFSDFDARSAELDHYMSELVRACNLDTEGSEGSRSTNDVRDMRQPIKNAQNEKARSHPARAVHHTPGRTRTSERTFDI